MKAFRLNANYSFYKPGRDHWNARSGDRFEFEKGTFVTPIWNIGFVPKEIKEEWIGTEDCVFCYTAVGILPIPEKYLEEAY